MRLYIYLAQRNKKGIKILTVLNGEACPPTKLPDITAIGLPANFSKKLAKEIYDHRMRWEPWVESAENFAALKAALKKRGYSDLPFCSSPQFEMERDLIVTNTGPDMKNPDKTIKSIGQERPTMLRKNLT